MNISQFNPIKAAEVPRLCVIKLPNGDALVDDNGTEVGVFVKGLASKAFRKSQDSLPKIDMPDVDSEEFKKLSDGEKQDLIEKLVDRKKEIIKAVSVDIQGEVTIDDKTKVTARNLGKLFDEETWIVPQIEEFLMDLGNFSPKL